MALIESNSFFRKVGFYKETTLTLRTDPETFKKLFGQYTSSKLGSLGFSRQEKKIYGKIEADTFSLSVPMQSASSRTLAFGSPNFAVGNGTFEENNGAVKVNFASYIPFSNFMLFYGVLIAITIAFPIVSLTSDNPLFVKIIFNVGVVFFHIRVYLMFRTSVKELFNNTVDEFERWSR